MLYIGVGGSCSRDIGQDCVLIFSQLGYLFVIHGGNI